jgi:hypothetical protein
MEEEGGEPSVTKAAFTTGVVAASSVVPASAWRRRAVSGRGGEWRHGQAERRGAWRRVGVAESRDGTGGYG